MIFDWDVAKSEHNLHSRGFDFVFASQLFGARYLDQLDNRREYGEERHIAIGIVDDICLTVVYTDRVGGDGAQLRRIISARPSNRKERQFYAEAIAEAKAEGQE